jgi:hypothetical protein
LALACPPTPRLIKCRRGARKSPLEFLYVKDNVKPKISFSNVLYLFEIPHSSIV